MKNCRLSREVEAISKIDDWTYGHGVNDDHKNISDDIDVLQKLVFQKTMYLVFWHSAFSSTTEDICICRTEEKAKEKCAELGHGHFYKELELF